MSKKITSAAGRMSNSTVTNDDNSYLAANIADYTVVKKPEGKYKLARTLYIIGLPLLLLASAVTLVCLFSLIGLALCTFIILAGWMIKFFTWRYLSIEYSYAIENSQLLVTEIFGEQSDRILLNCKMTQIEKVAPYEGEYKAEAAAIEKKIYAVSSMSSPDLYYAVFHNDDGERGVLLFEATNKTLKAFKYYKGQETVVRPMSR